VRNTVYSFVRKEVNGHESCTLFIIRSGARPQAVPLCIANEVSRGVQNPLATVATSMVLHWLEETGEQDAEVKAGVLGSLLRFRLYKLPYWHWSVTSNELSSWIADGLAKAYEQVHHNLGTEILECTGQRRDVVRSLMAGGNC